MYIKQKNKFGIILPIVLISYFLILLDNSVVLTSTVSIAKDLSMTNDSVAWITNIYALMFGSLLLIGGKLGDAYGRKLIFTIGLMIFGLGSLLVGLLTSRNFIITMRAFQGIGSAIVASFSLVLIIDNYNDDKRERAISYYGITAGLGAGIGSIIDQQCSSAYIGRFFFAGTIISYFFLVSQTLQIGYGFTPLLSAFAFMPETVLQFLFGIVQSKLADKYKDSTILLCGMIITILEIVLSFILKLSHGYWLSIAIHIMIIDGSICSINFIGSYTCNKVYCWDGFQYSKCISSNLSYL